MEKLGISVVVFPENGNYTSWCPELDIASQGHVVDEAIANLKEAVELHLECLSPSELQEVRLRKGNRLVATVEVSIPSRK